MNNKIIKLFLRLALSAAFLSAVADRLGWWNGLTAPGNIAWGNWADFVTRTQVLMPFLTERLAQVTALIATAAEIVFGLALLLGWKLKLFANLSGILLLLFAIAMTLTTGIKSPLNASVFTASAAAFTLAILPGRFLEIGKE